MAKTLKKRTYATARTKAMPQRKPAKNPIMMRYKAWFYPNPNVDITSKVRCLAAIYTN